MSATLGLVAKFRTDEQLLTAVSEKARREGRSRSAVIRQALKRDLEEAR